ncbi:MAG: EAL domain-containing protein [Alphaproteobacteria bacterium]|nr:EAL domain-containing protein [Alphaproteobacteria bacterium]
MGDRTPSRTVLVVEDNPGDARLVELFLIEDPSRPFLVFKAETLAGALESLAARPVDVVLLDLSLPDSFGLDTLARLRGAFPLIPVVVLTGTDNEALALEALRQGAQDYLVKGQGDGDLVRRSIGYAMERFRGELALRSSEARFRAVFESAGIGVVTSTPDGQINSANPAFCEMLGYDEAELRTFSAVDITHPDDRAASRELYRELVEGTRDRYHFTKRYVAKDGRHVWVRLTVTAVKLTSGQLDFSIAVIEDITEKKRLEDHMRLAATVFENSGEGLFVTDSDSLIIHVNAAFSDITGYQAAEVIGKNPRILASGRHDLAFYEKMWSDLTNQGRWQGEIWDRRKDGEMFASWENIAAVRDSEGVLTNYVAVISDITTRKQVEERLSYAANHDPLTRLPNRTLFQERLGRAMARAQRNQALVALLFIDLDRFKQVNDSMGHLAGDMLLQQVAERLTGCTRQGDTVARLAGDEFTVILEDVEEPRDAAIVAHKILHRLVEPFDLGGEGAQISSSIGVALYPSDAADAQGLIKLADEAMYRAKHMGRNRCQFHSLQVNAQAFERLALEASLRHAMERDEFELVYQPIFDLASGRVAAVEALLRWRHPEVGTLVPAQFLPLAEETGLVLDIGAWALTLACGHAVAWRKAGYPDMELHINLSGRQLREGQLLAGVALALEDSALPPQALVLEVPETQVVDRGPEVQALFQRIAALNLGLSIDEFGSGYSSFAFLRGLGASSVKVAQAYVRSAASVGDDAEIVSAIVALARGLHMAATAPGIETAEQLDFVIRSGCSRGQGFLLARPMTVDEMADFLAKGDLPVALKKRLEA